MEICVLSFRAFDSIETNRNILWWTAVKENFDQSFISVSFSLVQTVTFYCGGRSSVGLFCYQGSNLLKNIHILMELSENILKLNCELLTNDIA